MTYSNELYHFGVKGMRWGVWNAETKARYSSGARIRKTPEERGFVKIGSTREQSQVKLKNRKDAEWLSESLANMYTTYNTGVDVFNEFLLPKINKEWEHIDIEHDEVLRAKYDKQIKTAFDDALNTVGNYSVYNSPSGELTIAYDMDLNKGLSINLYSRNKETVRHKKLQDAEDRGRDRFNADIDKLSDKFYKEHGLSNDYDLGKNPKMQEEYDMWMMEQYANYVDTEQAKVK